MKRVLIVTSTWQPAMIADMQRARMISRHLRKYGWEAEVLAPDISYQPPQCIEPESARFFDEVTPFHPVPACGARFWDMVGSSTISWRALWPVLAAGNRLLAGGRYDLVFFSTAHYMLSLAGCLWKRRHAVPFVMDLHDPWHARAVPRPDLSLGIRGKLWRVLTAAGERASLGSAAGVVAVSPAYLEAIAKHYGDRTFAWQRTGLARVEPFGFEPDSANLSKTPDTGLASTGPAVIAYCGAGGRVMRAAWSALCRSLADLSSRDATLPSTVRFVFAGTSLHYRMGDALEMVEKAREHGVARIVSEEPARLSYADSIGLASRADGLLLLGVDEIGYMASKLFSYVATGKPLLAVVRRGSVMLPYLQDCAGVTVLEFGAEGETDGNSMFKLQGYLQAVKAKCCFLREPVLASHTAAAMTQRLAELFERCAADPVVLRMRVRV